MTHSYRQPIRRLAAVELLLADRPDDIPLLFERAGLLATLGQIEPAKQAYLAILRLDHTHLATLNNFGALLFESGFTSAARTVYTEAIAWHPDQALPHVNLGNLLLASGESVAADAEYEQALRRDPDNVAAHRGLCAVCLESGDQVRMQQHRHAGYGRQALTTLPYLGDDDAVPLLVLLSSVGGDLPWRHLVDAGVFACSALVVTFHDPGDALPPHQLIFNAIGDADCARDDLEVAAALLRQTGAPVINPPHAVMATGRLDIARRLGRISGVVAPRVALLPRPALLESDTPDMLLDRGFRFPLLVRRVGFHTGKHFTMVNGPGHLTEAVESLPGNELMVIQYLDASGPDGCARKYRVMVIDGQLYPLHLAISEHWKVHYFTAAMSGRADRQAEEAKFLNDMPAALGERAVAALHRIGAELGLDYAGVDFGVTADGTLLLFEANATMLIHPPDADPQWDYRRPAIDRALRAAKRMLAARAGVV